MFILTYEGCRLFGLSLGRCWYYNVKMILTLYQNLQPGPKFKYLCFPLPGCLIKQMGPAS